MPKPPPPTISELLEQRRYDPNAAPIPDQVILTINGRKVGALQNLVTITGKQKNGKSRYAGAMIAAGISNQEIFKIRLRLPPGRERIAIFDTEQSDYDFSRFIQQIKKFTGAAELPPTFDAFNTREDDPLRQLQFIGAYLAQSPDCSVIVVDGLLDCLLSYNDEQESKRLINTIKKWTKLHNVLMVGIMHRGKGNDLTVGHIGSMADRMAQGILKVEKNRERNTFCLTSDYLRSDEDIDPIEIWYNPTSHNWEETLAGPPESTHHFTAVKSLKQTPAELDIQEHRQACRQIFHADRELVYDELVQQIKEHFGNGTNWAKDCHKFWRTECLIFRGQVGWTNNPQAKLYIAAT